MKKTFKQLEIGAVFEFDSDLLRGPWVKVGPRRYRLVDADASPIINIGSIKAKVVQS